MKIKLIATDIDGVWTDGGMYYDNLGNEWKKFHTYDSAGVLFCRLNGIKTAVLTGEETEIVKRRSTKLKIDFLFQGVKNKLKTMTDLCKKLQIDISEVAYLGDDINDLELLKASGLSACPISAPDYIKEKVDLILEKKGGDGAYREFVEKILSENNLLEITLEKYFNQIQS